MEPSRYGSDPMQMAINLDWFNHRLQKAPYLEPPYTYMLRHSCEWLAAGAEDSTALCEKAGSYLDKEKDAYLLLQGIKGWNCVSVTLTLTWLAVCLWKSKALSSAILWGAGGVALMAAEWGMTGVAAAQHAMGKLPANEAETSAFVAMWAARVVVVLFYAVVDIWRAGRKSAHQDAPVRLLLRLEPELRAVQQRLGMHEEALIAIMRGQGVVDDDQLLHGEPMLLLQHAAFRE